MPSQRCSVLTTNNLKTGAQPTARPREFCHTSHHE